MYGLILFKFPFACLFEKNTYSEFILLEHSYWERQEEFLTWLVEATWHRYGRNIQGTTQQMVLCYFDAIRGCLWRLEFLEMKITLVGPKIALLSREGVKKTNSCRDYTRFFKREVSAPSRKPQNTKKMPCHGPGCAAPPHSPASII